VTSLVFVLLLVGQVAPAEEATVVRCLCGTVVYEHAIPLKNAPSNIRYKTKPMRDLPVALFAHEEGVSCCQGTEPVAATTTSRGGKFKFKGIRPGPYWLLVRASGRDSMAPIRYEPMKGYSASSSTYTFALTDTGELDVGVTVTVD